MGALVAPSVGLALSYQCPGSGWHSSNQVCAHSPPTRALRRGRVAALLSFLELFGYGELETRPSVVCRIWELTVCVGGGRCKSLFRVGCVFFPFHIYSIINKLEHLEFSKFSTPYSSAPGMLSHMQGKGRTIGVKYKKRTFLVGRCFLGCGCCCNRQNFICKCGL